MHRSILFCFACILLVAASCSPVSAGWTFTNLKPIGGWQAYGTSGDQHVGATYIGSPHAALWNDANASWVDLNPAGTTSSRAYAVSDGQQVGYATVVIRPYPYTDEEDHAVLWSGRAASWVDLNPVRATWSCAYAVSDGQQVGYAVGGYGRHAGMWSGTAASWVDLNPIGSNASEAHAVSNGQQVGYASIGNSPHAALWSGTAESWVDLNPAAECVSYGYGISEGQEVGTTYVGAYGHASLWSGTAASWVDLNPSGAVWSEARGVCGGLQVGTAYVGSRKHASLWCETATSWIDLQALLPSDKYSSSQAFGVYTIGEEVWVVGSAYDKGDALALRSPRTL